jgi:predicted nucleotidyltransferase component of viral defense system
MSAKYASHASFKTALEDRIRKEAEVRGIDIAVLRQRCVFDRFLARVNSQFRDAAILKGGVALALLVPRARMTNDVDLSLRGRPEDLLDGLQSACRLDLGDYLEFEALPDARHPNLEGEGMVYDGRRFRIQAKLAGKPYGGRFGLDVAFGDRMLVPPELRTGDDFFHFAGLPPTTIPVYAREVHLAEKLHAYTLPRARENSRVKDLPDMALLATTGVFRSVILREAIEATFAHRGSHPVPTALPAPPTSWTRPYADMAQENDLPWATLEDVFTGASTFLNPVLAGEDATWDHVDFSWRASR